MNNYKALTDAGCRILAPANPGFYLNPTTVAEVVDFVAGKLLDWSAFTTRSTPGGTRRTSARRRGAGRGLTCSPERQVV